MTKELFRRLALNAIEQLMTMPDDLWEGGLPLITVDVGDERVVVGIMSGEDEA